MLLESNNRRRLSRMKVDDILREYGRRAAVPDFSLVLELAKRCPRARRALCHLHTLHVLAEIEMERARLSRR